MAFSELVNTIGGIGGIIGGISAWLAFIWANRILQRERATQDKQLELLKTSLESIKEHNAKFTSAQFDTFNTLWCALMELKNVADELWRDVCVDVMIAFNKSLKKAREKIQKSRIFLDDKDYQSFLEITSVFESYRAGKQRLIDIQDKRNMNSQFSSEDELHETIQRLTQTNSTFRNEYQNLLNSIAESLKKQLGLKLPQEESVEKSAAQPIDDVKGKTR